MPVFIAALIGGLIQAASTIVGKVLISLGVGYAVFSGLDVSLTWVRTQVASSMGQLGTQSLAVLSAAGVGVAVNIVLSAVAARLVLLGVTSGTLRKFVVR